MHLKQKIVLLVVLVVALIAAGCQDTSAKSEDIVAKVGDQEITKSEYDKNLALYKNEYEGMYDENIWSLDYDGKTFLQAFQEQILDKIVNDVAIANYLQKNDVKIDETKVDERYTQYMEAMEKQSDLKDLFEENDIDEGFIRNKIKTDIYMEEFYNVVIEEMDLSNEKLKEYYDEHYEEYKNNLAKASHILVKTEEEANDILNKIKSGENFEELAKEYSEDPGTAANGGNLGPFSKGMMVPEFEEAAFDLKPGEISEPVKTQYGYHIIKAFEVTFEDVKEDTKNLLINERYLTKLEEIKKDMAIEKFEETIK